MFEGNEKKKVLISMSIFFILFVFLYLYEINLEPDVINISSISFFDIGNVVHLQGEFFEQSVYHEKSLLFGNFKDTSGKISLIFFEKNKTFSKGKYSLIGKVGMYENELQIVGIKVKKIE